MRETPRVPHGILSSLKRSLKTYYPELREDIEEWRSSSAQRGGHIHWRPFDHYKDIFTQINEFLGTHEARDCMILTFSSAITVRGSMGDLARIRRYLVENGIYVNENYKRMDHERLFLSTTNSSKGLERKHVLIISTFPLEKAFVNFSNDLVLNLVTVGISRSKETVDFMIPNYKDKYSSTLEIFSSCPAPTRAKIREDKDLREFGIDDYLALEHSVTEIIKQGIVKYDTRIKIKEFAKWYETAALLDARIPAPKLMAEEEAAFVGILIENLITHTWTGAWPRLEGLDVVSANPMYAHCIGRIHALAKEYGQLKATAGGGGTDGQFKCIYAYTQCHVGLYNKIFMSLNLGTRERLCIYWGTLKPRVAGLRPAMKLKVQANLKMPLMTGICDVMADADKDGLVVWELKASIDREWRDNALFQALLYALMTGKTWCRVMVMNPFRNEKHAFHFNMKEIMRLRQMVIDDIQTWNLNCYLAKNARAKGVSLKFTDCYLLIVQGTSYEAMTQAALFYFASPTKVEVVFDLYAHVDAEAPRKELSRPQKLALDSALTSADLATTLGQRLQALETSIYYHGPRPAFSVVPLSEIIKVPDLADAFEVGVRTIVALSGQYRLK
jgi:hypothetical protein